MSNSSINAQKVLDETISKIVDGSVMPSLFLHCCCAPCSSYVLDYLSQYFKITAFYYNPNISSAEEYDHRAAEMKRLIEEMPTRHQVSFHEGRYDPESFFEAVKGYENEPEGGSRCERCYRLRLEETARISSEAGYDFFTTTLSISPHKNASLLNKIGKEMEDKYTVPYLISDFKKHNGYKRSIELSKEYGLYRQNYCGCIFSQMKADNKNMEV